MRETLVPGVSAEITFTVDQARTVPEIFPESDIIAGMPPVFATGYMVALMEWCCCEVMRPHLEDGEGSLGTHIDVSHVAATPIGFSVQARAEVEEVDGRSIWFKVRAHDGEDLIGEGRHRRAVVRWDRFAARVDAKSEAKVQA